MSHPIHILHLEDNRRDAELIRNQLEAEGLDCEVTLAGDRQAFESALNQGGFDLILCDNSLPDYDGLSALVQARAKQPATPFIFVSGTLGEEVAVECLTTGATDYVLKQRLLRLGPAVRRALADAAKAAELNRAEESMRESESKYRQLVESLSDAAFLADEATGRILDTNPQAELLLGRTRWEIVGSPIEGSHSPATAGAFRQWWLALREQRHAPSQDGEIVRADGQVVPVHVTAAHLTFHQRPLILVLYRDITALKQIEARLRRLQSPDAEARANRPLRLLHLEDNPRDAELIRDRLEADGQACEVTLANGRQAFESALEQAAFDLILCDYKLPDYDGGAALVRARAKQPGVPVIIVSGTLGEEAAVDCLKNGATDYLLKQRIERLPAAVKRALDEAEEHRQRQHAEAAMIASEAQYRRLFESAKDGILILNAETGRIVDVNPFLTGLLGCSREAFIGKPLWELGVFKDIAANAANFAEWQAKDYIRHEDLPLETSDGRRVEVEFISNACLVDEKRFIQCNIRDITERRKLEAQIRQSQKMEGIGQLAGGVAHDFNNILAVIQMQADLLKTSGNLSPAQFDFAEQIGAAIQRAAALTRQLLLFSRKEILQLHDLDLNQSLNNMSKMLRRILGENIQMQFKFAPHPLFIHADAGMMDQVLMNLAINSRDAMPQGGRLVIETAIAEFDEAAVQQSPQVRPGSFVCLSVSDTGCGIPAEILPRIFEPFFTTKGVGKGTGLGLATVFGIVQQHQGWIHVYSEPGHGTTFRIYLPWLSGTTDQTIAEKLLVVPLRGGNETILVVEDDAFLRGSVCKALSQLGYRLLEAGNGAEALEVWRQHRAEINLMLTDLVMPGGMNGKELAERILKENPKLKVIYASGYSAEVAAKNFPLAEGVNFLAKPFQTFKLAQTVRKNLDTSLPPVAPA